MNTERMHEILVQTEEGMMTFPQSVQQLLAIGVESYCVDFAAARKTHYLADGSTHTEPMLLKLDPVAAEFDASALVAAIRGAQADTVRYPEFVQRSTAAGVAGYYAFLTGRRAIYYGRKGEQHVEEFPKPRQ
jgi:uncharacterized protein YbcV (DUF1398 family)